MQGLKQEALSPQSKQQNRSREPWKLDSSMPQRIEGPLLAAKPLPVLLGRSQQRGPIGVEKPRPPPGLPPPADVKHPMRVGDSWLQGECSELAGGGVEAKALAVSAGLPGVHIVSTGDGICELLWCIDKLRTKLRYSRGFAVLSPLFAIEGLPEVRMMFAPGREWKEFPGAKQLRKRSGPQAGETFGAVNLKTGSSGAPVASVRFQTFFDEVSTGPAMDCDLTDRNVHSCPLQADWREHLEDGCDKLTIRVRLAW